MRSNSWKLRLDKFSLEEVNKEWNSFTIDVVYSHPLKSFVQKWMSS